MSKQSSVQWLFQKLWDTPKDKLEWQSIFLMAHEMHKEEIINSYQAGDGDAYNLDETRDFGEQYYNETFGGQDNEQQKQK